MLPFARLGALLLAYGGQRNVVHPVGVVAAEDARQSHRLVLRRKFGVLLGAAAQLIQSGLLQPEAVRAEQARALRMVGGRAFVVATQRQRFQFGLDVRKVLLQALHLADVLFVELVGNAEGAGKARLVAGQWHAC